VNTATETADTSPDRAIAEVRALLGPDYDAVISALANAPHKIGPPRCANTVTGPDLPRL
jgi:hypothetical protein